MTKFCTTCGGTLESDARFCIACGAPVKALEVGSSAPVPSAPASSPLEKPSLPATAPETVPRDISHGNVVTEASEQESAASVVAANGLAGPKRRIARPALYVALGVIAAIALGGGGYWAWNKKTQVDERAVQTKVTSSIAKAIPKEDGAAPGEQELRKTLNDGENRGQRVQQDRVAAEAGPPQEAQGREEPGHAAQEVEARAPAAAASVTPSTGYETAAAAGRRGDYRGAYLACQGPAQMGDTRCQNTMGILYVKGYVGTRSKSDLQIAANWFRLAAQQNQPDAQFNLGLMQERGMGIPRDVDAAIAWYRRAASQGNEKARQALNRLGNSGR